MKIREYKAKAEVKFKSGRVISVGETVAFRWDEGCNPILVRVGSEKLEQRVGISTWCKLVGKKLPTDKQLEHWVYDSVCLTPLGNRVEPDGHDSEGCPSWLMVLGLI